MTGGRLDCGLSKEANSYMLLGHACDFMGTNVPMPEGWVYITTAVCGDYTYGDLLFREMLSDFYNNSEFIQSPCEKYGLSKKFSYDKIVMNFHYKNAPDIGNKSFQEMSFYPLDNGLLDKNGNTCYTINEADSWECSKSGVYINGYTPSHSDKSIVVMLFKNRGKIIITEDQIHDIYEGSIYPIAENVIEQTKLIKQEKGSLEPEGQYSITDLEEAVSRNFKITMSQLIDLLEKSGINEGYIINPLCRSPCNQNVDNIDIARRRANSLAGLNANDAADMEEYLGGRRIKRTKNIKRKTQRKQKFKRGRSLKKKTRSNK